MGTRRKASIINSSSAIIGQFLSMALSFISRTIFIRVLGEQYLGLNGLFTNLLNILSFAELGIGTAIVVSLYKPLNENNIGQVKALMLLYKKCYYAVAVMLVAGGSCVSIFLPKLIAGSYNVGNIYLAFGLYLLNSVLSYLWSYKRSILIANQEGYINSLNQLFFNVIMQVLQIVFLFMFKSYYIYLIIQASFTLLSNLQISRLANRHFNYLTDPVTEKVNPKTLKYLRKNIVGMIASKIGEVIVYGTDNLLLSSFLGLAAVGQYSNYTLIVNGVGSVINQGFSAVTASIGNLRVSGSQERQNEVFFQYSQLVSYVSFFISIAMALFFPSFIQFWVGKRFILSPTLSFLIVFNFFVSSLRYSNLNFMSAYGTYWEMRYKSILEALVNFVISIVLIKYTTWGISAVVIGTLLANLTINAWWEPLIVFQSALTASFKSYIRFYAINLVTGVTIIGIMQYAYQRVQLNLILSGIVCLMISCICLLIFHLITISFAFPKKYSYLSFASVLSKMFHDK